MTIIRAQTAWNMDSALPRDSMVVTTHFERIGVPGGPDIDWAAIAKSITDVFRVGWTSSTCEMITKLYDLGDTPPRPVKATDVQNAGLHPLSGIPREIAVCLSFYGTRNLPHQRGRIYLPLSPAIGAGSLGPRPSSIFRDKALGLATVANQSLPDVGGIDVKHGIWSPTTQTFKQATDYWVDDEWDTVRRRGLRATTRGTAHREG